MERQKHQSTEMMIQVKNNANENDEISKHLKKLSAFCSEFSQIKEDAKSFGEKLQKHEMKMHNDIEEIKKQIKNLDASIKSLSTENMKIGKNLSDFKSHSDECQKNMSKDTCESLLDLKKQVENKLENVQMPHFNALEKEKKLIYDALSASNDKMHNILLDLENSLLKSGNNEMQLKIFEKKLENIYLLIKKYEMQ
jgi:chromosome segregation ATPase